MSSQLPFTLAYTLSLIEGLNGSLRALAARQTSATQWVAVNAIDAAGGDEAVVNLLCDILLSEPLAETHGIRRQGRMRGVKTKIDFHPATWMSKGAFTEEELERSGIAQLAMRYRYRAAYQSRNGGIGKPAPAASRPVEEVEQENASLKAKLQKLQLCNARLLWSPTPRVDQTQG